MADNLKKQVLSGMAWRFGERTLAQLVTFGVSVVLARILSPSAYGDIAILMIFIELADVFVVHGFGTSLVQKKDADNLDFTSVFYFSIGLSILIYTVFFFTAPLIGVIFGSEELPNLFRVLALRIPLSGINSVQQAYVQRNMLFRRFFFSTLAGTVFSAVIGILLAINGFGAWALVAQVLGNSACDTLVLWFTVRWRPDRAFSLKRLKSLLGFGWKMLLSQLIHVIYQRLAGFVIGTKYTSADLAFYEQGHKIPGIVETNIDSTINSVLFPAMAQNQDNKEKLKSIVRRSVKTGSLMIWPMMIGLLVLADETVTLVYTEKWLPCVFFMQLACIRLGMEPVQTAVLQAIKALGRSDLYVVMEVIKKACGIIIILITMQFGVKAMAIGWVVQAMLGFVVNAVPIRRLLGYSLWEQAKDIVPCFLISLAMGVAVYYSGYILPDNVIMLFVRIIFGVVVYGGLGFWLKREDLMGIRLR